MGAEETKEKLLKLKAITAEQQERGAEKLNYEGTSADGTIEGVVDEIGNSPGIENAVVIKNTDVPKLLKSYIEIEVKEEYKLVYAGVNNQIVVQGMILFPWKAAAPNGKIIKDMRTNDPSELPDIPFYTEVDFNVPSIYDYTIYEGKYAELRGFYISLDCELDNTYSNYLFNCKAFSIETGENIKNIYTSSILPTTETGYIGVTFAFESIHGPGEKYDGPDGSAYISEFGYVKARMIQRYKNNVDYLISSFYTYPIPFASMDEYNAAVILTSVTETFAVLKRVEV